MCWNKIGRIIKILLFFSRICITCYAVEHTPRYSFSVAYAHSKEADEEYKNHGKGLYLAIQTAPWDDKLYPAIRIHWNQWHAETNRHQDNQTFGVLWDFRSYLYKRRARLWHPFVELASGPVWLEKRRLGHRHLGANIALETQFGLGLEYGRDNTWAAALSFVHVCNAGLASPNKAFNLPWVIRLERGWIS